MKPEALKKALHKSLVLAVTRRRRQDLSTLWGVRSTLRFKRKIRPLSGKSRISAVSSEDVSAIDQKQKIVYLPPMSTARTMSKQDKAKRKAKNKSAKIKRRRNRK